MLVAVAAFPSGVTIGLPGHSATFDSSSAVQSFLPAGGLPGTLAAGNATNPATTPAGVLAGQVLALSLSVGFDQYDPGFGASSTQLSALIVDAAGSPFYGMSVQQVLKVANRVLGNDFSDGFTAAQVNGAVTSINENFVDGTSVGTFLRLP